MPDGRAIQHFLEYALVLGNGADFARLRRAPPHVTAAPAAQSIDGLLDLCQRRRIDGKLAQAARQKRGDAARVAGHVAAQADC